VNPPALSFHKYGDGPVCLSIIEKHGRLRFSLDAMTLTQKRFVDINKVPKMSLERTRTS